MRSKVRSAPPPPPSRSASRWSGAIIAVVLLVVGGGLALSLEGVVKGTPGASPSSAASLPPTEGASPSSSDAAAASASPEPTPTPAAPVLEAEMPTNVNGTVLTVQSATSATSLGQTPTSRALDASMASLGKKPTDLEVAESYDASGALTLAVLGFRVAGVEAAKLRPLVFNIWLSANEPAVKTSTVTLAGTTVSKITYADSGPSEYLFTRGDSVFVIETDDESLATKVVQAMPTPGAASPAPSSSAGQSAAPSGSAAPSPSS